MSLRMKTSRFAPLMISLLALGALVACGQDSTPAAVTVSIDQTDSNLVVGGSLPLSATVTATGGAAETVTWNSSDQTVATVSSAGLVEAAAVGVATITATSVFDTSKQDSVQITVSAVPAVTDVSIDQDDRIMAVGGSVALTATVTAVGGAAETFAWTSSDETVATVSSAGLIEALAVGDTTITATSTFDTSRSDTVEITTDVPGSELWTYQFGTTDWDYADAIAVDSDGNILITGSTEGDLEGANVGFTDGFVSKLDSNGSPLWTHQFGTTVDDYAIGIAVDSEDNVVVVGLTDGDLEGASEGGSDAFARKLDSNGSPLWTYQFGTTGDDYATAVAVDSEDNVVVVGRTYGDFEGSNEGRTVVFVLKLGSDGAELWRHQFGSSDWDSASGVAVDSDDNVLIVGETDGGLEGANEGGSDAFVRKLDSNANPLWTRQFGTGNDDAATAVAVDSDDNVVIVGMTGGNLAGPSAGSADAFVTKFDSDGIRGWTYQFGTNEWDFVNGVAVDSDDNVLIAGETEGDLAGPTAGDTDAFITKVNSEGIEVWTHQFGTPEWDSANGIAVDSDDNVLIAGETDGDLGGPNTGYADALVRKHLPYY